MAQLGRSTSYQRVLRGRRCLQGTEVVDQGFPADRALHAGVLQGDKR